MKFPATARKLRQLNSRESVYVPTMFIVCLLLLFVVPITFNIFTNKTETDEYLKLVEISESTEELNTLLGEILAVSTTNNADANPNDPAVIADKIMDGYLADLNEWSATDPPPDLLFSEDPVTNPKPRWREFTSHPDIQRLSISEEFFQKTEDIYLYQTFTPYNDISEIEPVERNLFTAWNGFLLLIATPFIVTALFLLKPFFTDVYSISSERKRNRAEKKQAKTEAKRLEKLIATTAIPGIQARLKEIDELIPLHGGDSSTLQDERADLEATLNIATENLIRQKMERARTEIRNMEISTASKSNMGV